MKLKKKTKSMRPEKLHKKQVEKKLHRPILKQSNIKW